MLVQGGAREEVRSQPAGLRAGAANATIRTSATHHRVMKHVALCAVISLNLYLTYVGKSGYPMPGAAEVWIGAMLALCFGVVAGLVCQWTKPPYRNWCLTVILALALDAMFNWHEWGIRSRYGLVLCAIFSAVLVYALRRKR